MIFYKKTVFILLGLSVGLLFPLWGLYVEINQYNQNWSFNTIKNVFNNNPLMYIISTAPIVFVLFSVIILNYTRSVDFQKGKVSVLYEELKDYTSTLEKQNGQLSNILKSSPCSYIILDSDGIIEYLSPSTKDVYGSTSTIGLNMLFIDELKNTPYIKAIKSALGGKSSELRQYYHKSISDKKKRCYNLWAIPLNTNLENKGKVLIITEDITREMNLLDKQKKLFYGAIAGITHALEAKDQYTKEHSLNVKIIAGYLGKSLNLHEKELEQLSIASELHDIGKIGIPDNILNKRKNLTDDEFEKMKLHTYIGSKIISEVDDEGVISMIIYQHHERIDGLGYPEGIKGSEIHFLARILSVADAIDAMASKRSYKNPYSFEKIIHTLEVNSGTQFDYLITKKAIELLNSNHSITELYNDLTN